MEEAITIRGTKELVAALYQYSQRLGDFVIYKALRVGANVIKKSVIQFAPRRTGKLQDKGFLVAKSKINNGRTSTSMIGVYLTIAHKKKNDPFYGRFVNDGWNVRGASASRGAITAIFGSRTGRRSLRGKRDVYGKEFIDRGWNRKKETARAYIVEDSYAGMQHLQNKLGL